MAALSANRSTRRYGPKVTGQSTLPCADNVHIYQGALVALNAAGYAVPMSSATALAVIGCAQAEADNTVTGHTLGGITVDVWEGDFMWDNGTAGDTVLATTPVGSLLYAIDDHTVGITSGGSTRSLCGVFRGLDSSSGLTNPQVIVRTFVGERVS